MPSKANPLADLLGDADSIPISGRLVPNQHPKIKNVPYRLAIIGEAPGADEEAEGKPFVGYSGRDLDRYLSKFGILRDACFIGNVCQHRPPSNKIAAFDWTGPQIQGGLTQLKNDLTQFQPNCILLLGGTALHAFRHCSISPKRRKTKDGMAYIFPDSVGDWRGSFFHSASDAPLPGVKCIAGYHPAACMRQYEWTPYLLLDISRAASEARTKELILPQRTLLVNLSYEQTILELEEVLHKYRIIGTDIEGFWYDWKCIGIATAPDRAFIVPWTDMAGNSWWTEEQERVLTRLTTQVLSSTKIAKVWQNGCYDRYALQRGFGLISRGPNYDIMLRHWENHCELDKDLGTQNSIYTKEPFYKGDVKSQDRETFWRYCCKDAATTLEIFHKLRRILKPISTAHAEFNESLQGALLYMQIRGLALDEKRLKERRENLETYFYDRQYELDKLMGQGVKTTDKVLLRAQLRDVMCWKNDPSKVKAAYEDGRFDINMRTLLGDGPLTKTELGRLSFHLGLSLNVQSDDQVKVYLYKDLALPVQKDPKTFAPTSDYEALLTLLVILKKNEKRHKLDPLLRDEALKTIPLIIELTEICTRLSHMESMISCTKDFPDRRIHTSYNEVGSGTGRVTCGKWFKKYGYPMQTVEDENDLKTDNHPLRPGLRDLIIADPSCYLAKCDLRGADGWTVGANLASCGDSTMLDDLRFGIKPANFLAYGSRHGYEIMQGRSRQELLEWFKEIKKSDWDYFAYKVCCWGFCYLMGATKSAQEVFNKSEGTVEVSEAKMEEARLAMIRRYQLQLWWRKSEERLKQPYPPIFESPSGHIREFWGRRQQVLGELLAHEPQSVTTYATNMAVKACWTDPENRYKSTPSITNFAGQSFSWRKTFLHVEPMHQVHDEFLSQFKIEKTEWATSKIKQWFNNEIVIAGIKVTIPYEGSYGTNWAMNSESKKGNF